MIQSVYDEKGREVPDKTPVEMPLGYERPESLESMIARMVRNVSAELAQKGGEVETFEESDDFDVDDEGDLMSQYQMSPMQEEVPSAKPRKSSVGSKGVRGAEGESASGRGAGRGTDGEGREEEIERDAGRGDQKGEDGGQGKSGRAAGDGKGGK